MCCSILEFEQTATFCVPRSILLVCVTCCVLKRLTRVMLFGVLWLLFVSVYGYMFVLLLIVFDVKMLWLLLRL